MIPAPLVVQATAQLRASLSFSSTAARAALAGRGSSCEPCYEGNSDPVRWVDSGRRSH